MSASNAKQPCLIANRHMLVDGSLTGFLRIVEVEDGANSFPNFVKETYEETLDRKKVMGNAFL